MSKIQQNLEAILSQSESAYGNKVIFDEADSNLVFAMAFADTKAATDTFSNNPKDAKKSKKKKNKKTNSSNSDNGNGAAAQGNQASVVSPEKKHHFMVKLMGKCGHSCVEFVSSNWQALKSTDESSNTSIIEPIYTRQLTIKTIPQSRFSLFPKKNSQFEIKQTKIELQTDGLTNDIVIYNECIKRDCDSKLSCEFRVIEKWEISTVSGKNQCQVKLECGIVLDQENLAMIRTKVLRYCMQNFNEWRLLIKDEYLVNYHKMKSFLGNWNKINSYFHIKIVDNPNQIIYNDGSTFDVTILNNGTIRACYADGYFDGKMAPNCDDNILKWNNGSVWIRNGFEKFAGIYSLSDNNNRVEIDCTGKIIFTNKTKTMELRFVLTSADSIMYIDRNHKMEGKARYEGNCVSHIEWANGQVWQRRSDAVSDAVFEEILSEIPQSESNSPAKTKEKEKKKEKKSSVNVVGDSVDEKEASAGSGVECTVDFEENIIHVNGFNDHYFNVTNFEFDCDCCKNGDNFQECMNERFGTSQDEFDSDSNEKDCQDWLLVDF